MASFLLFPEESSSLAPDHIIRDSRKKVCIHSNVQQYTIVLLVKQRFLRNGIEYLGGSEAPRLLSKLILPCDAGPLSSRLALASSLRSSFLPALHQNLSRTRQRKDNRCPWNGQGVHEASLRTFLSKELHVLDALSKLHDGPLIQARGT